MKYVIKFDSAKVWKPEVLPIMDDYLTGRIDPTQAMDRLNWTQDQFLRSLGHIFALLRNGFEGFSIKQATVGELYNLYREAYREAYGEYPPPQVRE